jgi:alpha-ketoglutarate-dependent taurine dioxygenase
MDNHAPGTRLGAKLGSVRRKAVTVSQDKLVSEELLRPEKSSALVIRPALGKLDLVAWAADKRDYLRALLHTHGAILFRSFEIDSVAQFERFIAAVSTELLEYRDRSSPRERVGNNIYTSTTYPPEHSIFLHNENSYSATWPQKIFFHCVTAPQAGGETPIADCRNVYRRIDETIRKRFEAKRVMYVRNYGDGFGLPWQSVFQTTEQTEVDEHCRRNGIETEWKDGNRLRTRAVRPATARHPSTGAPVWFNHAAFFHVTTLGDAVSEALTTEFEEGELPSNTYYGDGSPIERSALEAIREAYAEEKVLFGWEEGDILMLDNLLTAHGRAPFAGPRKVVVGMAEPFSWEEIERRG